MEKPKLFSSEWRSKEYFKLIGKNSIEQYYWVFSPTTVWCRAHNILVIYYLFMLEFRISLVRRESGSLKNLISLRRIFKCWYLVLQNTLIRGKGLIISLRTNNTCSMFGVFLVIKILKYDIKIIKLYKTLLSSHNVWLKWNLRSIYPWVNVCVWRGNFFSKIKFQKINHPHITNLFGILMLYSYVCAKLTYQIW